MEKEPMDGVEILNRIWAIRSLLNVIIKDLDKQMVAENTEEDFENNRAIESLKGRLQLALNQIKNDDNVELIGKLKNKGW